MRLSNRIRSTLQLTLLVTACVVAQVHAQSRIVGGTPVAEGNYPWMAAIVHADISDTYHAQFCGGSLIDKEYVLTAAHCLFDDEGNPYNLQNTPIDVLITTTQLGDGSGERLSVEKYAMHAESDIALLKLKTPADIAPVELLVPGVNSADPGTTATVIGWGLTQEDGNPSDKLLEVRVPIVSTAVCKRAYPDLLVDLEICAGLTRGGKDSCQGDSGGPLFVTDKTGNKQVQAGVVSHGEGCARPGFPGVYASVSAVADWIDATMANGGESEGGSGGGSGGGGGNGPTADFKVSCNGLNCSFDARTSTAGDGAIEDYIWEIGPNMWRYGQKMSYRYRGSGNREVTLYVFQEDGDYDYKTRRFSVTANGNSGNSGLVSQQWSGKVDTRRRVAVPGRDGISIAAGQLQVILAHGRGRDFDLLVQKLNEGTGRWQTIEHAATQGARETARIKPSQAGQYRFIVHASRGAGRFKVIARHP